MTTTIQLLDKGPILVKGDAELLDGQGNKYPQKDEVYLCRCGLSNNKPFCDGLHQGKFDHCAKAEKL